MQMLAKNVVVKRRGDCILLYDSLLGGLSRIQPDLFERIGKPGGLEGISPQARHALESAGLVVDGESGKDNPATPETDPGTTTESAGGSLRALRLNITKSCNLSCAYCYVDRSHDTGIMALDIAMKALEIGRAHV